MVKPFGYLLKFVAFIAVLAIIALAIGVEAYAILEIKRTLSKVVIGYNKENTIVKDCLKSLDLVLLGVILFSVATGLFELYIKKIPNLPEWLVIDDLDGLKSLIIKMVIFIMVISFAGRVITYDKGIDIACIGGGIALVIASLTYFLQKK